MTRHLAMARHDRPRQPRADRGRNCGTCDFWQPSGDVDAAGLPDGGTCRRYAPAIPAGFPATHRGEWCGEYECAEAARDMMEAGL